METSGVCGFFWEIVLFTWLYAFMPSIIKMVIQFFYRETQHEVHLRQKASELKVEMLGINMIDEFARYAKLQRKLNKINDEVNNQANLRSVASVKVKFFISLIFRLIGGLVILYILWNFRHISVMTVDADWISPVDKLLSYPIESPGAVSVTAWFVICSKVANMVAKSLS